MMSPDDSTCISFLSKSEFEVNKGGADPENSVDDIAGTISIDSCIEFLGFNEHLFL